MEHVAIIGSGISGLATAYSLLEKGYRVTMFSKAFPPDTTSNKAAAFWFPYHVRNDNRCIPWCQASYHAYAGLSANPSTGITMHRLLKVVHKNTQMAEMDWLDFMPEGSCRLMERKELHAAFRLGYEVRVPLIESHIFLPWLMNYLQANGVDFVEREIQNFSELSGEYGWVVNCAGLGARELCQDESIYPVRGQVAVIAAQQDMPVLLDNEQPFYIVPRQDVTIIGGTFEEKVSELRPEPAIIEGLYRQAVALYPHLEKSPVVESWCGLRPYRKTVRIEKEPDRNIIHNYGHGGSGFTLAWGCAAAVVELLGK
jgi:D-amino-acid oxidase